METLLKAVVALALGACLNLCAAQEQRADSHRIALSIEIGAVGADTPLGPWTDGGLGKLRFDDGGEVGAGNRIAIDYRGRLRPTVWANVVADVVDDAARGLDVAEAYLLWRPVPKSPNRHQLRFGAFYPPLSFENSGPAWSSPYTISFSAINTWIGEEIRPIGVEWTWRRRLGGPTSRHELAAFAAGFYGNDPAATLLFWRGWSVHDRQTRLGDSLDIPPLPVFGAGPRPTGFLPQPLEPFTETDSRPGIYAGIEWSIARQLRAQVAHYDNRADPYSIRDGQWGWRTELTTLAIEAELPRGVGLIAQWMRGDTVWISGASRDGSIRGPGPLVTDEFNAAFVLLTRAWGNRHRVTARWDRFDIERPAAVPVVVADDGTASTLAYVYAGFERLRQTQIMVEWLRIRSTRDVWSRLYGIPRSAEEQQLRLRFGMNLDLW